MADSLTVTFTPLPNDAEGYAVTSSTGHLLWAFFERRGLKDVREHFTVNAASLCCSAVHWGTSHKPPRSFCKACDKETSLPFLQWDSKNEHRTLEEHLESILRSWGLGVLEAQVTAVAFAEEFEAAFARLAALQTRATEGYVVTL